MIESLLAYSGNYTTDFFSKLLALAKSCECEPQGMTLLQDIADRSASLLAAALKHEECRDWGVYYLAAVRNRGFAKGKQRVDQASFREAFSRFFAPIANVVPQAFNGDWPVAMVRKHRKAFHPLQHILLQMFLDRYPVIVKPADPSFEEGPWECLNHLAEHFGRKVVESLTVRRERDRFVGRFSCACGCSYTRVAGSSIPPRIVDYGPLLDVRLKQRVREGLGLRSIARDLGVDTGTVRLRASKLGLPVPWKALSRRNVSQRPLERDSMRAHWLDIQCNRPALSRHQLARLCPREHAWLYRNDREWLIEHSPAPKHGKWLDQRVDWKAFDRHMAIQLRKAAKDIHQQVPPRRVTQTALVRTLEHSQRLFKSRSKLPESVRTLDELVETVEDFRLRRITWAVAELNRQALEVRAWRVRRLAGLPPKASARVEAALTALVEHPQPIAGAAS